jgi:hydroxymethylpyrimidine pyrophosphatase-like HAD family hydrolase
VIAIKYHTYAVDFDDTLFDRNLKPLPNAIHTMQRIKENGGEIAIWTCRTGMDLRVAAKTLDQYNIPYDTINDTLPSFYEIWGNNGRKIWADVYVDNASIHNRNGIDWYEIEKWIFEEDETT